MHTDLTRDFWLSSGHHLLDRLGRDGLAPTSDFLRAFLARPEMVPVAESCPAERRLHAELLDDPLQQIPADRLEAIRDPDARENYQLWLTFRNHIAIHPTLELAYLALLRQGMGRTPRLFVDQLAHVILRNLLDGTTDPFQLRAAECLFRTQRVSLAEGCILLADHEVVQQAVQSDGPGTVDLDVLNMENAKSYWFRSDLFDMVLDVGFTRPGLDALARVLEKWVRHFTDIRVRIQPLRIIQDEQWCWHVGLDAEATRILNALWAGDEVDSDELAHILALFRLDFEDPADMLPVVAGRPVYLAMAMTSDRLLRLKPQNLLMNLPFAERKEGV